MTCIAGVAQDGKVWIGGDSAGVAGWSLTVRADEKVFRNGPMVMGFTSSFRMGQLLRFSLTVPKRPKGTDDYKWLCTDFIDAVRQCLKAGGYAEVTNERESGGDFLVGYRGALYCVRSDFQVERPVSPFAAVGCGDEVALGALAVTRDVRPRRRVELALRAAEAHNAGVRGPFTVVKS